MSNRKLSDQIIEDILSQIGSGQLGEGSIVPSEFSLCTTYKVTRGVVREAIRSLDAKGFIKVSQGMGTTVAPVHQWNVLDPVWVGINSDISLYDYLQTARELLEPEIAALAAQNATLDNIKELQALLKLQINCIEGPAAIAKIDVAWHAALSRATQNPILNNIHNMMANLSIKVRIESAKLPAAVKRATDWHEEIMQAVEFGNAELAKAAMRMHMNQVKADLRQALKTQTSTEEISCNTN